VPLQAALSTGQWAIGARAHWLRRKISAGEIWQAGAGADGPADISMGTESGGLG